MYTQKEIRAYRQAKRDRYTAKLRAQADRLEAQAEQKMQEFKSYHGDHGFMFQPAKANSPFAKRRARITDRYEAGLQLLTEADELRKKADWIDAGKAQVKGDAERKRQATRDALDKLITVGTRVHDFCFGDGEVVRVYPKSYRIKFDRTGSTFSRDKSYVRPL
jgi:hypothetical protein